MGHTKAAILSTLCYSDIFDYPLTKSQLWRYLLSEKAISYKRFENFLEATTTIQQKYGYYFLLGRQGIVKKRQTRQKKSLEKLTKVKPLLASLAKIPTVELIGISGSLAMKNADENADVDLFIITKPGTIWITRLLMVFFLQIKNVRRKRKSTIAKNTVCLNMLIDTSHLAFPKKRQDIYTAHEIMQMQPVFSRDFMYERFLKANKWIRTLLPNSYPTTAMQLISFPKAKTSSFLGIFEKVAKITQLWYMKRHRTNETILEGFIAFHPLDYRKEILAAFAKKCKTYL